MSVDRIRKVKSQTRMEDKVDDYITLGYEVVTRGENSVKLQKKKGWGTFGGHFITFLLTSWWTLGIGNLIYALIKHYRNREIILVKVRGGKENDS